MRGVQDISGWQPVFLPVLGGDDFDALPDLSPLDAALQIVGRANSYQLPSVIQAGGDIVATQAFAANVCSAPPDTLEYFGYRGPADDILLGASLVWIGATYLQLTVEAYLGMQLLGRGVNRSSLDEVQSPGALASVVCEAVERIGSFFAGGGNICSRFNFHQGCTAFQGFTAAEGALLIEAVQVASILSERLVQVLQLQHQAEGEAA